MKIFYKVNLTGPHNESDLISIGLTAGNGLSAYCECNNYDKGKVDEEADEMYVSNLLGKQGMKELISTRKKTKGMIAPGWRVAEYVNAYLSPYDELDLITFADTDVELRALSQMLDEENSAKKITFVKLSGQIRADNISLLGHVAKDLPEGNALRTAIFYKHIYRKQ